MSIFTTIALVCGVLFLINMFWDKIATWIKSKTNDEVDEKVDEITQLKNNFDAWLKTRMLPGLSAKAIELLDLLRAELLNPKEEDNKEE